MKLSFATLGCPDWTLEQIAANAKAMKYDGVEVRAAPDGHVYADASAQERARVRELFAESGVEICALMGYSSYVHADAKSQEESVEDAIGVLQLARDLGCPLQRVFIGVPDESVSMKDAIAVAAENLKPVVAEAEKVGVKVALETHDAWTRGEAIRAVVDSVASPFLGVCWDVGNSFFCEPTATTFKALGDIIIHVHLKDGARNGEKIQERLPGEGEIDLLQAVTLLENSGYCGYYSFEWEKRWHRELAEPEIAFPAYQKFCAQLRQKLKS